jgi:hypothetical protein
MSTIQSPNMSLPIPVVGEDPGPDWAENLNSCFTILDQHNHAAGSGVPINPAGININADLTFNSFNLTGARSVRMIAQGSPIGLPDDLDCVYVSGVDLYYNDGNGNQVRITQSGGVAGSPGSIGSLTSPASATYVSANDTFVWQSDANTPANMDAASYILRNLTANSFGLTLAPPNAMGSNTTITLPTLPASTKIMTLDSAGNMGANTGVDNSTLEISSNTIQVKDAGITRPKLSALGQQQSSSSTTFASASTSFVDVTNLTVTITNTGRPIFVGLVCDQNGTVPSTLGAGVAADPFAQFQLLRGATVLGIYPLTVAGGGVDSIGIPVGSIWHIDAVAAGTYTYKIQAKIASGILDCKYAKLVAYEIG